MVNMNKPMDELTEKALSQCYHSVIDAHIVFTDDGSEDDVSIAVGLSEGECDDDAFYYAGGINDLRSLLKGSCGWETNGSGFYITSFSNGEVSWEAK